MRCFDMTEEEIHCSVKIGTKPWIFALPPDKKKRLIARQGLAVEVSVVYGVSVICHF